MGTKYFVFVSDYGLCTCPVPKHQAIKRHVDVVIKLNAMLRRMIGSPTFALRRKQPTVPTELDREGLDMA